VRTERLAYLDALIAALGLAGVVGRGFALRLRRRAA
jgi:hypothetical protein